MSTQVTIRSKSSPLSFTSLCPLRSTSTNLLACEPHEYGICTCGGPAPTTFTNPFRLSSMYETLNARSRSPAKTTFLLPFLPKS